MKHILHFIVGCLFSIFAMTNGYADDSKQVNFLNWAEYIDPSTIDAFQKQTGIRINQSFFDGSDMLKAKLMAGGSGYDLTVPALSDMIQEIPAGVFQPLDKSKLPNYKYRDPEIYEFASKVDPDNTYGIVYMYGTTGISYNPALIKQVLGKDAPLDQWKIIFDPNYLAKLKGCGVAFLDEPVQVFGLTLHYLGLNPNSTNPADYYKAAAYLMTIRQYLIYFDNNRYITDLAAGNICIAMGYSGDTMRAKANAEEMHAKIDVEYSLPKGGAPIWFDMLAIPKNAPHVAATLAFINYLMDPKVAAKNSNFLFQPSALIDMKQYYDPLLLTTPGMLPDNQQAATGLFNVHIPPPALNDLETKLWMQVKYGIY
jgi:putrescine transport system substrate-binding protein